VSSSQLPRSGVRSGQGGYSWVTGVGAAQDRIRAVAGQTEAVLDRLVHAVSELVDAPATVALVEDGELVRRAGTGDGRLPLGVRVETATSVCGEALRTGVPVRVGDTCDPGPGEPDGTCCPPARSMLSVPLAVRGTGLGVVALTSDRPDWFDGVDENTVTLVAEVAAGVLLDALPPRVTPRAPAPRRGEGGRRVVDVTEPAPARRPPGGRRDLDDTLVLPVVPTPPAPPRARPADGVEPSPPARSLTDEPVVGQPVVGQPGVGQPGVGQPVVGQPVAERPVPTSPAVLGLWQWDAATGLATLSEPVEELAGLPSGRPRVLGAFRALVHPDDVALVEATVREAAAPGAADSALTCTFRLVRGRDDVRTVQVWGEVQRNRNGLVGAVGAVVDVTSLNPAAGAASPVAMHGGQVTTPSTLPAVTGSGPAGSGSAVDASGPAVAASGSVEAAQLRAVRELTGCAVWSWRPSDDSMEWSPEMFRLVGLEPGEIVPTRAHWHGFVHPDDVDRVRRLDAGALDLPGGVGETFRVVGADGAVRHVQAWAEGVPDPDQEAAAPTGAPTGLRMRPEASPDTATPRLVRGAALDVTRQVHDRARLERLAATDPVTGLANRAAFERRLTEMLAEPGVDVALLLLDVDRFKQVNDSLGPDVGDRLLVEVARRLTAVAGGATLLARLGGDEFVVLPRPGLGQLAVRRLAEAITDALRMPYVLPTSGELLVCPVSLGITTTSGRGVQGHDLLAEAELALHRAKDTGRDRYVVYDDALRARSQSRLRTERLLRAALEQGRLAVQYQPIVDLAHGRVVGAEALVRIRDESGDGLLRPDVFIDVAEDTGLVVDVDRWVIDTAIDQVERWAEQVPAGRAAPWLSINVSARSMEHPGAVRGLLDAVRQRRVASTDIKVELTERSFLSAMPGGEGSLRQLLGSGIPVGIDDFGTGNSSLGCLQRFDLDFMKIDRSCVAQVGQDRRADAVITAVVDLAHAHGMLVTAEGVETPQQAGRLREIGCDLAQGYHFGRPAEAARILSG
jgi:diguanylate cyclase (GGDEF)-like protein